MNRLKSLVTKSTKQIKKDQLCLEGANFSYKSFEVSKGKVYLYAVYNKKNNIIKIGKASNPINRVRSHIANFISYGGCSEEDIGCIFTSVNFPEEDMPEAKILEDFNEYINSFRLKLNKVGEEEIVGETEIVGERKGKKIKNEFFLMNAGWQIGVIKIKKYMKSYTRNYINKQKWIQKNKNNYQLY